MRKMERQVVFIVKITEEANAVKVEQGAERICNQ